MWKSPSNPSKVLDTISNCTLDDARNPGQMTTIANHTIFTYEAIQASEQSRLYLGSAYSYTNTKYCNALVPCSP